MDWIDSARVHPPASGDDVLDWLLGDEARTVARRRLVRSGLEASADHVDDVLGDAAIAVCRRMQSPGRLVVDTPAAYGTVVIRNVVGSVVRGRDPLPVGSEAELVELVAVDPGTHSDGHDEHDRWFEDDVRVAVEHVGGTAVLTSAALALLTFSIHPDSEPPGAPAPRAGARADQARCWPALWLAGERAIFPERGVDGAADTDSAATRRTRARRISSVQSLLERSYAHLRVAGVAGHRSEWDRG